MKNNDIWMKRGSEWPGELWREALPVGNGLTGASLTGGVGEEHLLLNRYDLWSGADEGQLPDVSATLPAARAAIDRGDYPAANAMLADALRATGYRNDQATPLPLGELNIRFECENGFSGYRRGIRMDEGYAYVKFAQGNGHVTRRCFVSRARDVAVLDVAAEGAELNAKLCLQMYDTHSKPAREQRLALGDTFESGNAADGRLWLSARNGDEWYGAAAHVALPSGGKLASYDGYLEVSGANRIFVIIKCFSRADSPETLSDAFGQIAAIEPDFNALLAEHSALHGELYSRASLSLSNGDNCNEWLLDQAYEDTAPVELLDKLWHYGRYLFISGTSEEGYPFPLYGLWNGAYRPTWAQNVANENVEMIYWHINTGNLCELARPLIRYYHSKLSAFRESARKLFGCDGIYASTYTTPFNSLPSPPVPVILNFVSVAGWLSRHFYEYYRFTGDDALLRAEILPFMLEAARFYEDYVTRDADGRIRFYPSVSPENSPANFIPPDFQQHMTHANPVTVNATIEIAIMKELISNLVELADKYEFDPARVRAWRGILADLPEYMINDDGAIKEWLAPELKDFYMHRHLSHLYPVFPGNEADVVNDTALMEAFRRAVDLRELGGQSGWSLAHMASIYARLGQAERAVGCLDTMAKGCLLRNLFTLHNDYRDMGVTLKLDFFPVQLDAIMGAVNAVQEMLLFVSPERVRYMPARPERMSSGSARGWRFAQGITDFAWNAATGTFSARIVGNTNAVVTFELPNTGREWRVTSNAEYTLAGNTLTVALRSGTTVNIASAE